MNVYIMTDLECVAGILTFAEYCLPGPVNKYGREEGGTLYKQATELASREVNAAIEGLLEAGATEIAVCDGHGPGGLDASALNLDDRVHLDAGKREPRGIDASFDAAIMIGHHAKAHTDGGHLCHSGSFSRDNWTLNGRSIGEIELFMLKCTSLDVPVVMISGDRAACIEARACVPSIETVAVIEGQRLGSTKGMSTDEAIDLNVPAEHVSPEQARSMIREGVKRAMARIGQVERFWVDAPYTMERITRPDPDAPPRRAVCHDDNIINLLSQPITYE